MRPAASSIGAVAAQPRSLVRSNLEFHLLCLLIMSWLLT
jgi:hypothetical protein